MKEIISDPKLVAACGLYCGACNRFIKNKCPGCEKNEKAGWCKIRSCCLSKGIQTCASCNEFEDANNCKKFNNPVSKLFALIFRSDRPACIRKIKADGIESFSIYMANNKLQTIKRK